MGSPRVSLDDLGLGPICFAPKANLKTGRIEVTKDSESGAVFLPHVIYDFALHRNCRTVLVP